MARWETYLAVPESQAEKAAQVAFVANHQRVITISGMTVLRSVASAEELFNLLRRQGISFNWAVIDTHLSKAQHSGYVRYGHDGEIHDRPARVTTDQREFWRYAITMRGDAMTPELNHATCVLGVAAEFQPGYEQNGAVYALSQMLID